MINRVRAVGVALLKRNENVRVRYRLLRDQVRSVRFRWHARGPLDDRLVVFECFVGRSYAGSPRAVYEAMLDDPRYAGHRFVWALRDVGHAAAFPALQGPRTAVVRFGSAGYYRAYGRARTWIGNSVAPRELVPSAGQVYVQSWHGTPLKRIGLDVVETTETAMNGKAEIDGRYQEEARKITYFLSAAPFTTDVFASAFGLPADGPASPFVETGNPRNDVLATAGADDVAAARARLGIPPGVRALLYAPTWRDDQHDPRSGYVYRQPLDLDRLRAALGGGWVVLFRAHYLVTRVIDFAAHRDFVLDVSGVDEINELCLAADVLVTDYSSVYFDYALLDRPMVFFMYDLERYAGALRGFYLPVDQVPGPVVTTQDDLHRALLDPRLGVAEQPRRADVVATMCPHDDGAASARVLDLLHARHTSL